MWYPDWALRRKEAQSADQVVVVEGSRVVAARTDEPVTAGMLRRQAEALAPAALILDRDRSEEVRRFEAVVAVLESLIPRVEVADPGLAFVPIAGAVRYYGGEGAVLDRVLEALPVGARLGLADGPFAARHAAALATEGHPRVVDDTPGFLAQLEIGAVGSDELADTFRWLGVSTLGELSDLPRPAIASRFGEEGLKAHRLAAGEDRTPVPRDIPARLAVESDHSDDPLTMADQVAFVARGMAVRLMEGLRAEGLSPFRVEVEVEAADGTVRTRVWRSAEPFNDASLSERVWWQLRAWMDSPGGVPGGVVRIALDPSDTSGEGRQMALLEQVGGHWQEVDDSRHDTERALARAQSLVGPDAVLQAVPQGGRTPDDQVKWYPWGEPPGTAERDLHAPWPGRLPAPSPALVTTSPPLLEVEWDGGMPVRVRLGTRWETVLTWGGPWRSTGRWWRGEKPADRYQIVTSVGAVLCVVMEGRTYLAGVYD